MRNIEFTMTHVAPRHSILRQTVESLKENLVNIDFSKSTIYINIDPVIIPPITHLVDQREETKNYLEENFGKVISNEPDEANFSNALKWCWTQPNEELFFHIEDDWLLEDKVDVEDIFPFFQDEKVFAVNLRAYRFSGPRPCLLQAIYRKSFCNEFALTLTDERNPENQLRTYVKKGELYNLHFPESINDIVLKDIGRNWLKQNGLRRNQISTKFTTYKKVAK